MKPTRWADPASHEILVDEVDTYAPDEGWVQRGSAMAYELKDGDQFGAIAKVDGNTTLADTSACRASCATILEVKTFIPRISRSKIAYTFT